MSRRVVVTGLGAVTPIGNNVDDFWTSVKAGKIGFDHITKFDTTDYKCHIAAELKDFNPQDFMDRKAANIPNSDTNHQRDITTCFTSCTKQHDIQ